MITSWSPSRLEKYENCPQRAKLEIIEKLCPLCFQGKMAGKWQEEKCTACGNGIPVPDTWARGTEIHSKLEKFVNGQPVAVDSLQPWVIDYARKLKPCKTEIDLVFQDGWVPVDKYTKNAWARFKLDVLKIEPPRLRVVDWKSGGIDKRTGMVRVSGKYDDQVESYGIAALCALSKIEVASIELVFVDALGAKDGVKKLGNVKRKDLPKLKKKWAKRVAPMFKDDVFAPRPSDGCRWCPFEKAKGGPCAY